MSRLFAIIFILVMFACPLFGGEDAPAQSLGDIPESWQQEISRLEKQAQAPEKPAIGDYETWSVRDIIVCVFVLGLIAAALFFLNRWRLRMEGVNGGGAEIVVLSRRWLDQRNALYVVRVRGKDYLLGAGQQGANLLTELPEGEKPEAPAATAPAGESLT